MWGSPATSSWWSGHQYLAATVALCQFVSVGAAGEEERPHRSSAKSTSSTTGIAPKQSSSDPQTLNSAWSMWVGSVLTRTGLAGAVALFEEPRRVSLPHPPACYEFNEEQGSNGRGGRGLSTKRTHPTPWDFPILASSRLLSRFLRTVVTGAGSNPRPLLPRPKDTRSLSASPTPSILQESPRGAKDATAPPSLKTQNGKLCSPPLRPSPALCNGVPNQSLANCFIIMYEDVNGLSAVSDLPFSKYPIQLSPIVGGFYLWNHSGREEKSSKEGCRLTDAIL